MGRVKLNLKWCIICILLGTLATTGLATIEQDEKDCADQMGNLASCMPFVSGSGAEKPSPECCEDTTKVKSSKPKCLCVLIKESADPSMGLPINTTLALQMPSLCNIDAKVSDCPALLNLSPNSPDAKIFQVANSGSSASGGSSATTKDSPPSSSSSATSSTSPSSSSSSSGSDTKTTTSSSNGGAKLGRQSILFIIAVILL